jgi:hypothetical protein
MPTLIPLDPEDFAALFMPRPKSKKKQKPKK